MRLDLGEVFWTVMGRPPVSLMRCILLPTRDGPHPGSPQMSEGMVGGSMISVIGDSDVIVRSKISYSCFSVVAGAIRKWANLDCRAINTNQYYPSAPMGAPMEMQQRYGHATKRCYEENQADSNADIVI